MRYLIDTNIIVYIISDPDSLDNDVKAIIADPDNILYTSAESAKELVIAYRNKGLLTKRWKKAEDMLHSIEEEYGIYIRPLNREHIYTYAGLRLNTQQDHKDPSGRRYHFRKNNYLQQGGDGCGREVQLQLVADSLRVDVGFHTGIAFAEHQQHRFVHIVVYQQD